MSIHDSAYEGSLTRSQLRRHISTNPSSLNEIGGNIDLTPLCAACLGGHLDVVKHLLSCGADPNAVSNYERTPLFYITDPRSKASSATRCTIIRELISGKHGRKADLDAPCDDDKNTPLMNVIVQLKDKDVIQELVELGASLTVRHHPLQKTAKELAEDHDLARSLVSKAERDMAWANLVDLVVTFVLLIVQYVNNKTVTSVVGGIVKKYYDISVKDGVIPQVADC
jgi:ankyrin repeat protein